jgi:hypothetical protein
MLGSVSSLFLRETTPRTEKVERRVGLKPRAREREKI